MEWIEIGKIILGKISGKKSSSVSEIKKWQEVYLKHIEFITKDYEERIKYIVEEKKKHPENGFELQKHQETLDFYYKMTIKLNQQVWDLQEELLFTKKYKNQSP